MDSDEILDVLKKHKLFLSLDKEALEKLALKFTKIEIKHGDILFDQGSPPHSVFILVSGKLSALAIDTSNHFKTVGHIEAGETVGEMGALANEPRSLTIKALRDSVLLKLPAKDFIKICYLYPKVMFAAVHPIIERSQKLIHSLTNRKQHNSITIMPANHVTLFEEFAKKLLPHLGRSSNLILISDFHSEFNDPHITFAKLKDKIQKIEQTKKRAQKIVYLLESTESPLAKVCLNKSNLLYLVADGFMPQKIDPAILDKIHSNQSHFMTNPILILLHPENTVMPSQTAFWLQQTQFSMHHHIKINATPHYQRLLRFIRGKAKGLVLGGGGTRGWAHLGALKALREQKLSIDMIGGASVGAIVAGCYAMQESLEDTNKRFQTLVQSSQRSTSWRNLTWPYVSLFDGEKFTESLQQAFNDTRIEDLWLPYFCVSSNMATSKEEIHRKGLLWQKTRSSASIPGLIPPMVINGELHLDGGLLNNLPVDIMRQFLGKKGHITAIELSATSGDFRRYHFPPILTLKQTLLARLGINRSNYKFPRFIDNFLQGLLIGSSAKAINNGKIANVLVKLHLRRFRLLNSNAKQAERIIQIGYQEVMFKLGKEKIKQE